MIDIIYIYDKGKETYKVYSLEDRTIQDFRNGNYFHWLNIRKENLQKEKVNIKEYIKKNYDRDVNIVKY